MAGNIKLFNVKKQKLVYKRYKKIHPAFLYNEV